jgi:hypothetical protein
MNKKNYTVTTEDGFKATGQATSSEAALLFENNTTVYIEFDDDLEAYMTYTRNGKADTVHIPHFFDIPTLAAMMQAAGGNVFSPTTITEGKIVATLFSKNKEEEV